MRTGDQCRGGKAGAKCQQMGPEVVQDFSLAWGVKQKESPVPRGRRNIHTSNFFLLSFQQRETPQHGKMKERMLTANCILILKAFQLYPSIDSLLRIVKKTKKKNNYMYSRKWVRFVKTSPVPGSPLNYAYFFICLAEIRLQLTANSFCGIFLPITLSSIIKYDLIMLIQNTTIFLWIITCCYVAVFLVVILHFPCFE